MMQRAPLPISQCYVYIRHIIVFFRGAPAPEPPMLHSILRFTWFKRYQFIPAKLTASVCKTAINAAFIKPPEGFYVLLKSLMMCTASNDSKNAMRGIQREGKRNQERKGYKYHCPARLGAMCVP